MISGRRKTLARHRRAIHQMGDVDDNPFDQVGSLVETPTKTEKLDGPGAEAWSNNPFGPFADPREVSELKRVAKERAATDDVIDSDYLAGVDCRGLADWQTIFTKETVGFAWGLVVIDSQAQASPTNQTTMDKSNHVEIRIVEFIGGSGFIVAIRAIGNHQDRIENASGGPMRHKFDLGDVPDRIEIQARARQGGSAETTQNTDETLQVNVATRFHR